MGKPKETDASILMEFRDKMRVHKDAAMTPELKKTLGEETLPYLQRLVARGHAQPVAASLLKSAFIEAVR